jgi:hypothetical protein
MQRVLSRPFERSVRPWQNALRVRRGPASRDQSHRQCRQPHAALVPQSLFQRNHSSHCRLLFLAGGRTPASGAEPGRALTPSGGGVKQWQWNLLVGINYAFDI